MKNKNKKLFFGFFLILSFVFSACINPIMGTWWPENQVKEPDAVFAIIHFDTAGGVTSDGAVPQDLKIVWYESIGRLRPIEKAGFGFAGWFDERGNLWDIDTRQVKPQDDADGDGVITLTARWVPSVSSYNVAFNASPAADPASQTIAQGGKAVQPVNPQADDLGFDGWYREASYINKWDFTNNTVTSDITLYAKWNPVYYIVTFEANGGTRPDGRPIGVDKNDNPTGRDKVHVPANGFVQDPGPIIKENYIFDGWYTDFITFNNQWDFTVNRVTADLLLCAKWIPEPGIEIPPVPEIEYAIIHFDTDGGETSDGEVPQDLRIVWGETIGRLRPVEKAGFGFAGWFDENGNLWNIDTRQVKPQDDADGDGIITLTARWVLLIYSYNVAFNASPAENPASQTIAQGGKVVQPVNPQVDGLGFDGWYTDTAFNIRWNFANYTVTSDITLYAKWNPDYYVVTFEANGGTRPDGRPIGVDKNDNPTGRDKALVPYNGLVQDPGPIVREDYIFGGWYTDYITFNNQWDFTVNRVTANLLLCAKWIPEPGTEIPPIPPPLIPEIEYAIIYFDTDGGTTADGSEPRNLEIAWGETIGRMRPVEKTGFGFLGWFGENGRLWDLETKQVMPQDDVNGDGVIVLTARWVSSSVPSYTVSFDVIQGQAANPAPQTIAHGGKAIAPVNPQATGLAFDGWYREITYNNKWDFANNIVTGNIILYAKWNVNYNTVTFESDGGTRPDGRPIGEDKNGNPTGRDTVLIPYNGLVQDPGPIIKDDHIFGGWFTDNITFNNQWSFAVNTVTEDTILYAKWIFIETPPSPPSPPEVIYAVIHFETDKRGPYSAGPVYV